MLTSSAPLAANFRTGSLPLAPAGATRPVPSALDRPKLTPGRAWWLLRRDLARGISAVWHDYLTCDQLADHWVNRQAGQPTEDVPVCVLTGEKDLRCALWMLASWFHFTDRNWRIILHEDGSLSHESARLLRRLWPEIEIRWKWETDPAMANLLEPFPCISRYRREHVMALKCFDAPFLCGTDRYILLDSDLLFFSRPTEILDWVDRADASCWFNRDLAEANLITEREVLEKYHFRLWPRVNAGLSLLQKSAIDLKSMERWLADSAWLENPKNLWRVEQTLLAMAASRAGEGGLLPSTYEVSLQRSAAQECVMRHYVGAVRDRLFGEGIARLAPVLLGCGHPEPLCSP